MSLSGRVRSWSEGVFSPYEEKRDKTGRSKPPEVRTENRLRIVRLTGCSSGWPLPQWLRW